MIFFAGHPARGSCGRGREARLRNRSDVTISSVASLKTDSPGPARGVIEARAGLRPCSTGLPLDAAQREARWGALTIESPREAPHG